MLDYYGSFVKPDEEIDRELISYFKDYNKSYILKIINELRKSNILTPNTSVTGWQILVGKFIIKEMKNIIENETLQAKQRLEFMKYCDSIRLVGDVAELICQKIDPNLIIIKEEL